MKYLFLEINQKNPNYLKNFPKIFENLIEKHFEIIFSKGHEENSIMEKIKTNSLLNLSILSQNPFYSNFVILKLQNSNDFLNEICKSLIENKSSTKFRQHLQLLIISTFYSIHTFPEISHFLNKCILENLKNVNLNYQTNASLIIISAHIILLCLGENLNLDPKLFEEILEGILIYNCHHFHAVKITAQTFAVTIWENLEFRKKLTESLKNRNLLYQLEKIRDFVLGNKELNNIYSSHKFLKPLRLLEEINVENLMTLLEESSNYCNIFAKYKKSKKFCMSLYENIRKTITSVFSFNEKPTTENKTNEIENVSFQNRNKVCKIADIFHEIKNEDSEEVNSNAFDFIVVASFLDNLPNIAGFSFF